MRYLLDVDGVLADLVGEVLRQVAPSMTVEQMKEFHFFKLLPDPWAAYDLLDSSHFWSLIPPYPNAYKEVNRIIKAGHEVVFVSKPWEKCEEWAYRRRLWLIEHMCVEKPKYIWTEHKELVQGDVLIDDRPEHINVWQEVNKEGTAYLMDRPWNQGATVVHRVYDTDTGWVFK